MTPLFLRNTGSLDVLLNVEGDSKPLSAKYAGDIHGNKEIHSREELVQILKNLENAEYTVKEIKVGERSKKRLFHLQQVHCSRKRQSN